MLELTTNLNQAASNKLKDSTNYLTWKNLVKQALINASIYQFALREGDGKKPTTKDTVYTKNSKYGKWRKGNAKAYTILHQTCGTNAMRTIKSTNNAAVAQKLLKDQYKGRGFFLIDQSLHEFQSLSYDKSKDIASYNALFKDLKTKITDTSMHLPPSYYILNYLRQVAYAFPTQAERQRSVMRKASTKTNILIEEMLKEMLVDLINENRAIST